ncbi:MAG: glucose 1-dehydrogenase [Candidatus Brocadiaceae bacterium]|jgi:NAD(P)-dependent dehydrogenase (short-subunit alcohol dehydrogenase family)
MAGKLEGKVALVTGSTAGIGRACARIFAEEGACVVVNDHGARPQLGPSVAEELQEHGQPCAYFCADVADSDEVRALVRFALDEFGRLDVLMNNAVSGQNAPLLEQDEVEWDRLFASSVKAAFVASKCAIPGMIEQGGGAIINTSSVHGLLGGRGAPAYDAAKAALINLTRQMAVEYGRHGVRVNALCPGRILTEAKEEWLKTRPDEVRRQKIVYPLGRPGTMREAACAALFLACDDSSFVTGHALVVDGGLTAQLQDAAAANVERAVLAELGMEED